jgi:hypothetical protein
MRGEFVEQPKARRQQQPRSEEQQQQPTAIPADGSIGERFMEHYICSSSAFSHSNCSFH